MTSELQFTNVYKKYPTAGSGWALEDVSLEVHAGEFFALVGPSGCGKSTLLKLIAGLEQPSTGQITTPARVGMVFQSGALLPWLSIQENVQFGLQVQGVGLTQMHTRVREYLELMGLYDLRKRYPRELSGGQRQRVGLARALAINPQVLLMDEPFSALDTVTTDGLHHDVLRIWRERKQTIVLVSHSLEEAIYLADRVGVMANGHLVEILNVNLPRPRREKDERFLAEVRRLKMLFHAADN